MNVEPFGVKAGQQVSIAVINLNSNIPTFVIGEEVIEAETPGLVSLAETIASSQDLANKVAAFVGITSAAGSGDDGGNNETPTTVTTPFTTPAIESSPPSSSVSVAGSTKLLMVLSWVVLLGLPLLV
jgi:subtilase family serine protease